MGFAGVSPGFRGGGRAPLITLGSAPLDDAFFRAAVFEQLGEGRLEAAVVSDIAGTEAHAVRLDAEAPETVQRARLHQQIATAVFFESSGGQVRHEATLPELRLAVGGPEMEIGNVEAALEDLVRRCYYLDAKGTAYWLSHRPTLNKILADRRATFAGPQAEELVQERVRSAIRDVFKAGPALERRYFPEESGHIPDTPALTLVVLAAEEGWEPDRREATRRRIERMMREYGERGRTLKSALLFAAPEGGAGLADEVRTLLALETLEDPAEQERLRLEPAQVREIRDKRQRGERDLRERVWRTYRHILLLGEDGLHEVDLGLLHSSAGESLVGLILARLRQEGLLEESISPDFLVRNWPPALAEGWDTKSLREAFFASPRFPRLLNPEVLRETIARGVREGKFGYVGKVYGEYQGVPRMEDPGFAAGDVEFSEQVVLLPRQRALELLSAAQPAPTIPLAQETVTGVAEPGFAPPLSQTGVPPASPSVGAGRLFRCLGWEGELPPQKWMNFYTRVLTHFATDPSLRVRVRFEVAPETGITPSRVEEIRAALRELGLTERLEAEE